METSLSQEEIAGMARKSNLKEEPWKGKVTLKAFNAVDYQVAK